MHLSDTRRRMEMTDINLQPNDPERSAADDASPRLKSSPMPIASLVTNGGHRLGQVPQGR